MTERDHTTSFDRLGTIFVVGFAGSLCLWVAWFVTHLPWVGLSEHVALPLVIGAWGLALGIGVWLLGPGRRRSIEVGLWSGFLGGLVGLLLLGSMLTKPSASGSGVSTVPSAGLIAAGFLAFSAVLGACAGALGALAAGWRDRRLSESQRSRLPLFAVLSVLTIAPLLFIGGLVTSTNSGMAVPDWPNTFGTNMFLYPLGPRVAEKAGKAYEDIFFEHSHRLFGAYIGITVLALMIWTLRSEQRVWVKRLAVAAFVLVCVQGILGGTRVTEGHLDAAKDAAGGRFYAIGHGVLAQLTFGCVVALAVVLTPLFKRLPELVRTGDGPADAALGKRLKLFSTMLLHGLILQLVMGATYRHLRHDHVLWAHIAFSLVVTVAAMGAGFMYTSLQGRAGAKLARLGWTMVGVVVVQLVLGWVAFLMGGKGHKAASVAEALVRTMHQANGALLLALAAAGYVWAMLMKRVTSADTSLETGAPERQGVQSRRAGTEPAASV